MLRLTNLTLARGTKRLLDGAVLTVHAGHKVGLVGPNGCGKSSLFALIRGELLPDAGKVELPAAWTIAHVAQETPSSSRSALEFVQDGDHELRDIEREMLAAEAVHEADPHVGGERLAELHHRFEAIGGYAARARAATLLAGLGFAPSRHENPVGSFSGGWRMRLNLAQALMTRSDLLLLDEPTNHLDLDAVLWLEDWLSRYPGTLLMITHDRDFLDAVVGTIAHVDGQKLKTYSGNYSQFERERAAQLALQQATFAKQQRQIAHLQAFVDRFRAKATKAKQAQSRVKALERMERIAAAHVDSPFEFSFPPAPLAARQLIQLDEVTLGYGDPASNPPVLERVTWSILAGDRIGVLGPNGAGKSTLLKTVAGTLAPRTGARHTAQGLAIGYFAQHQVDQLRADETPLWHLARLDPTVREQELRDFLGGFDFRGDMAAAPVGRFSGGEKARLTLALLVRQKPNLLILDEPTNHLDIEMREALAEALQDYGGALVVVAHDRHLLRATADTLWLVADGVVAEFDGDLDDYRDWVLGRGRRTAGAASAGKVGDERTATGSATASAGASGSGTSSNDDGATRTSADTGLAPVIDRKAQKRTEAEARQRTYAQRKPLTDRLAQVERDLDRLGAEKTALEAWLASPDAYGEAVRDELKRRIARQGELGAELARCETQWLELTDALEQLATALSDR